MLFATLCDSLAHVLKNYLASVLLFELNSELAGVLVPPISDPFPDLLPVPLSQLMISMSEVFLGKRGDKTPRRLMPWRPCLRPPSTGAHRTAHLSRKSLAEL